MGYTKYALIVETGYTTSNKVGFRTSIFPSDIQEFPRHQFIEIVEKIGEFNSLDCDPNQVKNLLDRYIKFYMDKRGGENHSNLRRFIQLFPDFLDNLNELSPPPQLEDDTSIVPVNFAELLDEFMQLKGL